MYCYEQSFKYLQDLGKGTLVHGYITGGYPRRSINHAWVEFDDEVWDPQMDEVIDKDLYYQLVDARPSRKFTLEQAIKILFKKKHWGPW